MRTRTTRKCCVKGCTNPPAKDRKTCGKHGKLRASRPTKTVKADRVLRPFDARDFNADAPLAPIVIEPLPVERPYLTGIAVRDNGTILGLPTPRVGVQNFLASWLALPGHSLAHIERLASRQLPTRDLSLAICNSAAALVKHDLGLAVRA